jgi:hypothetical protein
MRPASRCAAALLCLAACKKSAPQAPAPAARFCDQDLTGVWLNSSDNHFAYRFRDHGDLIRGEFQERKDDGSLRNPDEPITFELHRTATALAGVMRSTERTPGGRDCPVEFGIDVTTCRDRSLQATVEMEVPVDEQCRRKSLEDGGVAETHRTEFVFSRDVGPEGAGRSSDALHPSGGGEPPKAH